MFKANTLSLAAATLAASATFITSSVSADAAVRAFAKVTSTGTVLSSSGVQSINHFGNGRYDLVLKSNISACGLIGTINTSSPSDAGTGSGSILVGEVNATTVFVRTATPSLPSPQNVDDDRPFTLLINCP